ncbi:MAG: hypothetical protein WC699_09490 [Bacteroidales bacterium]|jgi:hypothetical protein
MNLKTSLTLAVLILTCLGPVRGQLVKVEEFGPRRADTIILERNWRTRDRIIKAELEFGQGDTVTTENLSLSLKKIWNLQNFVSVAYRWESLPDGRLALILTTRDAFTITPVFGGRLGPEYNPTVKLGFADRNFLGRNIGFGARIQASMVDPWFGEVKVTIPRQLLWKNMSVSAGARSEQVYNSHLTANQLFVSMVNPFHEDYRYTFSPDFETGFLQYKRIPLNGHEIMEGADPDNWLVYNHNFWYVRITETLGTITHRRHQEEGYQIAGMVGAGFKMNRETLSYFEGSIKAEYNTLINPRLQFNARWEGHYSSSGYPELWTHFTSADIRGTYYGALAGPLMHLVSTGLYYTWLNWDYLAIEQSVFVQYASALTTIGDWSTIKRHYAIGTGFQFTMPMYPAGSVLISFSYSPTPWSSWFYIEL